MHTAEHDQILVIDFQAEHYTDLWSVMEPHLKVGKRGFVLDMKPVKFLNSLSIAAIITSRNKITQAGGKLVIANIADPVKSVFRILKLERLFALDLSLEAAIAVAK